MILFKNLPIRFKLLVGYSLVLIMFFCFFVYLFIVFSNLKSALAEFDQQLQTVNLFLALNDDTKELSNAVKSYILTSDPKWEREYDTSSTDLDDVLTKLAPYLNTPQDHQGIDKYQEISSKIRGAELLIIAKVKEGDVKKATELFDTKYESQQEEAAALVTGLVSIENAEFVNLLLKNNTALSQTRNILVITTTLLLLFTVFVALYFASSIAKRIKTLVASVEKVAAGDLSVSAQETSGDEIGLLAVAFNNMTLRLKESYANLEGKVLTRTNELQTKMAELHQAQVEISKNLAESERLNKLVVGRELKMIELKKEIADLRSKIS